MSKILSYNRKTSGEDWVRLTAQYGADEIEMISDPDGGLSAMPRTAIPSPFAQMDLVKNAFNRLSQHTHLHGERMDEKLVSDALDIAQLLFNIREYNDGTVRIVEWDRAEGIAAMKADKSHRLLAETMEMFLSQDASAFNFDRMDRLFFLIANSKTIGGTSPATLFMAAPDACEGLCDVRVEQNVPIFSRCRSLYERETNFVVCVYALFSAYPELKRLCKEVNNYIVRSFPLLTKSAREEVERATGNPCAHDVQSEEKARKYIAGHYDAIEGGVQAIGIPLLCARQKDRIAEIERSDFVIIPAKRVNGRLPLVLQNDLNATHAKEYRYVTDVWDDSIKISYELFAVPIEQRTLPATDLHYPWLGDDDFFTASIVKLDYAMNTDCFFDGNIKKATADADECDFLLPLRPLFFKYFTTDDLHGTIGGLPRFELQHAVVGREEQVKATLRIPVRKDGGFITLSRSYTTAVLQDYSFDAKAGFGRIVTVPFSVTLFPFVRSTDVRQYNIQVIDRALGTLENHSIELAFFSNDSTEALGGNAVVCRRRSVKDEKRVGSSFYRVASQFDYIRVVARGDSASTTIEGVLCPRWRHHAPGHGAMTFAVDFGTTNTHVEAMREGGAPEPLIIAAAQERMAATLYSGDNVLYDVIMKQEFVPAAIGADYGFPQRTTLSESEHLDAESVDRIVPLGDANIPFIYEKESTGYGNRMVTGLKWSTEMAARKRIEAYITEIVLLMRTKVLIEGCDIRRTRIVWFYPLSMSSGRVNKMSAMWSKAVGDVLGIDVTPDNLIRMPESVAPYYYYRGTNRFRGTTNSVVSIDIGGGSSDVAVFLPGEKQPAILSSFRFAADTLFGDGHSSMPRGDTNPMLQKYTAHFKRLFDGDDDKYGELNGILDDIVQKGRSEEISAFLFSVEQNKAVAGNDIFSFNTLLNEDTHRKIIFLYFYSSLIYYVAQMMKRKGITMPANVMFSGTGSKVLHIVGGQEDLNLLTKSIVERVYGKRYEGRSFSVILERECPKQVTCKGGLVQVSTPDGCRDVAALNEMLAAMDGTLRYNYSMVGDKQLTYGDMKLSATREKIADSVRTFNAFFVELCKDLRVDDRFLADAGSVRLFERIVNSDVEHHLATGWEYMQAAEIQMADCDDVVADTVFFYPVAGIIRDNLIENIV